ncbi:MAG: hypothetical protein ACOC56_03090 [Atribacterota bacterium]
MKRKINLKINQIGSLSKVKCRDIKAIQEHNEKVERMNQAEKNLSNIGKNIRYKPEFEKYKERQNKLLREIFA